MSMSNVVHKRARNKAMHGEKSEEDIIQTVQQLW